MPNMNIMPNLSELQQLLAISDESFLRDMLAKMLNMMMELEVSSQNNANKHERTGERKAYRNGTREHKLASGVGEVKLQILKLRSGESYYSSFLEPRHMVDKALINAIQEAYMRVLKKSPFLKLVRHIVQKKSGFIICIDF